MEINGRFWGTLDAAVAAGVDFPLLACRMAVDGSVAAPASYTVGLRYRWPMAFGLLAVMESPEPWRTLRALLAMARGSRSDLCLRDPLPHLAELFYVACRMLERRSLLPQRTAAWPLAPTSGGGARGDGPSSAQATRDGAGADRAGAARATSRGAPRREA